MNFLFDVLGILDRKTAVRESRPKDFVRQRVAEAAADLSRAGYLAARVELANESLCRLVELLYQADTDGAWANVDPVTYRILIPLPWGASGWKSWRLRYHEGRLLRHVLRGRMNHPRTTPLFDYNDQGRTWHLSATDYPTADAAMRYLARHPVLLSEWRAELADYRNGAATAQQLYRRGMRDRR